MPIKFLVVEKIRGDSSESEQKPVSNSSNSNSGPHHETQAFTAQRVDIHRF